ncbi:DUF559 domain-containing protein [Rhodococcus spelaei]|uniref:DUF559 domain-containing protein n=2 Tax=Rhodococcus spelaei TaxID=2546320 RepID=A0A541BAL7_9NOCA|nr:DUF559 domain-containing protein [Rhodococcus spelaei]
MRASSRPRSPRWGAGAGNALRSRLPSRVSCSGRNCCEDRLKTTSARLGCRDGPRIEAAVRSDPTVDPAAIGDAMADLPRGAESPWETRTRLLVVRAGFDKPDTQFLLVDDRGRLVAQVDMAWPEYRVVLEYDGDLHRERDRYARDVRRRNSIRRLGWDVVVATKELVVRHPDELLERVASALLAGGATDLPI